MLRLQRILAIDFGTKRMGLAISDPLGNFAQPLDPIIFSSRRQFLSELKSLIDQRGVGRILVGLPKNMDGSSGKSAEMCVRFADDIFKECGIEVGLVDERLSTQEAEKFLVTELDLSREKRKRVRDSVAACLILQSYLNQSGTKK